jgi:DNA repair exonuclease SbcCD ATPase subunit
MCKMVKKGVVGAMLGAGALALLFGTAAPSYVKTAFSRVRHEAKDAVPVAFEIDRARQQVAELEPAIHENIETIARAEVEIEHLQDEIAVTQANLEREQKALLALREHVDDGDVYLTGGVSYTAEEVQAELARRFDHYKTVASILTDKEETLKMRKQALIAARKHNDELRSAKAALMTRIEAIETRLRQIEAAQSANEYNFDNSALSRAKATVSELSKRVEVMARVAEQEGRFSGSVPMLLEPGRDIVSEIDAEFAAPKPAKPGDKSL